MARRHFIAVIGLASLCWFAGCEKPLEERDDVPQLVETGDLEQIEARGMLRILLPRLERSPRLPRDGYTLDLEEVLAGEYAREIGLEPRWIYVESRDQLLPSLLEGKGDVIAANLTVTDERKRQVEFTVPVATVREQIVVRANDDSVQTLTDLYGRRIALRRSSSFWETVHRLLEQHPQIEIEEVPGRIDIEEIIHRVASGRYDLTVADSNVIEAVLTYRDDVRAALDLTRDRSIAWAVRPGSKRLRKSLNRFLSQTQLTRRPHVTRNGDLPQLKQTKTLRLLTRNNAACYFLHRGEVVGFEYELVQEFARKQGLRLEVIVPDNGEDLLPWLREGRGDIVAAALTPTEERRTGDVTFSRPYNFVKQILVTRAEDDSLHEPADLAGRRVHVRRSSAYWDTLAELRDDGVHFELVAAPEEEETEEIIAKVAEGTYDLTLADSHILSIELTWRNDVKGAFPLSDEQPLAWAVRASNPELSDAVDAFLTAEYHGLFYNVIYNRYFKDEHRIRASIEGRSDQTGDISPYDEIVRQYAVQYGFDWRLILSQMYQESRFDPHATSFAGARGLMQVLPRTAEQLGFDGESIDAPEISIHAGVRYLDWVRDRFEPELPVRDRMWFSLAAYNAGTGHVREARRLARKLDLNPDRWFGHVERAMLLLARQEYAQQSRYGYCRCTEPVNYVRDILNRYNAYVDTLDRDPTIRSSL